MCVPREQLLRRRLRTTEDTARVDDRSFLSSSRLTPGENQAKSSVMAPLLNCASPPWTESPRPLKHRDARAAQPVRMALRCCRCHSVTNFLSVSLFSFSEARNVSSSGGMSAGMSVAERMG